MASASASRIVTHPVQPSQIAQRGRVIALLGAESTGKTELAKALVKTLKARGTPCTLVSEYLREWCDREGRVPRPDEQQAIVAEQTRRIVAAAAGGDVIADTTALMTAIYSDLLFADSSLYPDALAAQRSYEVTLVTALDVPWVADGLQRDGPHVREPVDALLRKALSRGHITYSVVYGNGAHRLANALTAIDFSLRSLATPAISDPLSSKSRSPSWTCERCSDPDCEHRLFSDLIRRRT
jgi:nicotinamide riboside kinase